MRFSLRLTTRLGGCDFDQAREYLRDVVNLAEPFEAASRLVRRVEFLLAETASRLPGDANLDGSFDSTDLVVVFQAGEYEDEVTGNSTWEEGDWNGDSEFDSGDLVRAFQAGHYELAAASIDIETAAAVDSLFRGQDDAKKLARAEIAGQLLEEDFVRNRTANRRRESFLG